MTKETYEALAKDLRATITEYPVSFKDFSLFGEIIGILCIYLKQDNPRFSSERFREAIGPYMRKRS